ncbi:MAG: M18 family aminopeptidase [Acidimicrobiales bacterium]|jgi:aspartyl aminopeptidase|nr:M18 family aminopeptidase [Acidimicrobiales bacterium]
MADPDVRDLLAYLDASPSPYHAVATTADLLVAAGFTEVHEHDAWPTSGGRRFLRRGGSLVAWVDEGGRDAVRAGFRVVGAHTDSPNLRVKPRPDAGRAGWRQLGVEVYGGALLNSWLDRDLGLSGRVAVRRRGPDTGPASELRLVRVDRPVARVPQLAIHLDRGVNDGLTLNAQSHLSPVWGLGALDPGGFGRFLADELGVESHDVLAWDVMLHDLTPATLLGADRELLASARIDNLLSCWAATRALLGSLAPGGTGTGPDPVPVVGLFDHEEIGSESASGAASTLLATTLERIVHAAGGDRDGFHRALARSWCVSADGAHATHPNYAERHEPNHHIAVNGGPVIKRNANVRYATDADTEARFVSACERAGVPYQQFVVRTDLGCGSTIGPVTAARLGLATVDVGVAQLSMHSARELCGADDPTRFVAALAVALRT